MIGAIALSIAVLAGITVSQYARRTAQQHAPPEPDEDDIEPLYYFDYLTFNEKFLEVQNSSDRLHAIEQLKEDVSCCTPDSQLPITITWISPADGEQHEYEVFCDGLNTTTECILDIIDREEYEIQMRLSRQCERLSSTARGSVSEEEILNAVRKKMQNESGE